MCIKPIIKIPLVLLENIFFSIFPNSRPIIERYIYNPYQFNENHIEYSKKQFEEFVNKVGGITKIKDKKILELGPGGSLGFGLLMLQNGASQYIVIEDGQHAFINKKQMKFYKKLLGNDEASIKKFFIFKNERYHYNQEFINFIKIDQSSNYDLASNSVDFIYSCAVLEHVHNLDLCFSEMARVLKSGGVMNHQVDLRDHIFSQKSLWFLKISDFWFKFLFEKTGEYVNRKRFSYYNDLINRYGLKIIEVNKNILFDKALPKKLLSKYSENDLKILSFNLIAKKI
jgi:SAM-dependent methyltransferase